MKISINTNLLAHTSAMVQRAASNKDTHPALSGLLLTAKGNELTIQATDLDIGIKKTIGPVDIANEGEVLVNAKYFSDLIRFLSEEEIELEHNPETGKLNVLYGLSSSSLNLYNPEEFPEIPMEKVKPLASISQATLRNYIKKTSFAAASNHFKPVFTGILFDFSDGQLTLVGSDTHRLAMIKSDQFKEAELTGQFVVPVRTLTEIARIIEDSESEISIGLADNHIVFFIKEEQFYCSSRLIEGYYPNYQQVIPDSSSNIFTIGSESLIKALDRAALLPIDPKSIQSIRMKFNPSQLTITAFSEKMGELTEVITDLEALNDESFEVSFNTRYLLDIVKILNPETKTIQIGLNSSLSPATIKNPSDEKYIYVLVPLRTG
ncbi:MAG: DNA polymerase III subunit beta [Syntrophomonadaceae bacterium]|nr:DNA polymerase III subunit beta [Syntrophomonadaceae bacterium]